MHCNEDYLIGVGYERATNPMLELIEIKKRENIPLPPYFAGLDS